MAEPLPPWILSHPLPAPGLGRAVGRYGVPPLQCLEKLQVDCLDQRSPPSPVSVLRLRLAPISQDSTTPNQPNMPTINVDKYRLFEELGEQ